MEQVHAYAGAVARAQEPLMLFEPGYAAPAPAAPAMRRRSAAAELASELRPRERLLEAGAESLSNAELLGILLGAGGDGKRALELAGQIISEAGGILGVRSASYHDLLGFDGVGRARACVVLAAVELGKRFESARGPGRAVVSSPADVRTALAGRLRDLDREHLVVMLLNAKNEVLECPTVSVGTLSSSLVHPREVFKPAIRASAASVILAHNHPSGQVQPSREDREATRRLADAARIIGIEILDHVILGDGYFSMKEHEML